MLGEEARVVFTGHPGLLAKEGDKLAIKVKLRFASDQWKRKKLSLIFPDGPYEKAKWTRAFG